MTRTNFPIRFLPFWVAAAAFLAAPSFGAPRPVGAPPKPGGGETRPRSGPAGDPTRPGARETNRPKGFITAFALAKPGEPEDVAATLSIKPIEKDSKTLKLIVPREGVEYKIGEKVIEADAAFELIGKGLYCTAGWGTNDSPDAKKKSTVKKLTSLTMEVVEVEGTLEEIASDHISIKGKPIHGDWPDVEPDPKNVGSLTAKPVKSKSLKIRTSESITKFLNKDGKVGDSGEYQTGEPIEAFFVYSKTAGSGLLVTLRHPLEKTGTKQNEETRKRTGPVQPPIQKKRPGGG